MLTLPKEQRLALWDVLIDEIENYTDSVDEGPVSLSLQVLSDNAADVTVEYPLGSQISSFSTTADSVVGVSIPLDAHNGWPANWPLHPRHDAPESGPFPDFGLKANYIFVPFEKPVQARYVKFVIQAQPGWGFQLTEVNVWDSLDAQRWTPRLAHDPR